VSCEIDEVELPDLPTEFRGLPYRTRELAFEQAVAALPLALVNGLGSAQAELVTIHAASHILKITGEASTEHIDDQPRPMRRIGKTPDSFWAGSSYGAVVAAALAKLARPSGRGRSIYTG
jgi:hypothetical protein